MKKIIATFFILMSTISYGVTIEFTALKESSYKTGDILLLQAQSESEVNWEKLVQEKLPADFYLLKLQEKFERGAIYQGVLLGAASESKFSLGGEEVSIVSNINYKKEKIQFKEQGFTVISFPHIYEGKKVLKLGLLTFFILNAMVLVFFIYRKLKRNKISQRDFKEKQNSIYQKMSQIKVRKDIEDIYLLRKKLHSYFYYSEANFSEFVEEMNKIQFKKEWSSEENQKIMACYGNLYKTVRKISGV